LAGALVMARDSPTTGRREGIVRALVACACRESSPKTARCECCSTQSAFTPFSFEYPLTPTLRSGCGVCPQLGHQILCCDFNVLYLI